MRILHVIRSVDSAGGGPMEVLRQLAPMYKLHGHEMVVASLDDPRAPHVNDFPARVHALGPARSKYGFARQFTPWLRENAFQYDIAVINGIWNYSSLGAWCAFRHTHTPYVVFTHGMLDPWFKRTFPLKHLKKWIYWPFTDYRVLRDAKAVLFTSDEERLLARESFWLYDANEIVVSYGTARPIGERDTQIAVFLEKFPHLRGKRLILFMGRVHPKKGCDLAIEAFARVLKNNEDYHLVMAGPDHVGWRSNLEGLAERLSVSARITWTGMLRDDLKWGALRSSEVFFLPSHQENFGIAVAEALACGVPVLISNKVNIWREVESDGAGVVEQDNVAGAISLLQKWTELPQVRKDQMHESARDCFDRRFEIREVAKSILGVLLGIRASADALSTP